jgi:hypothetical protein
MICRQSGQKCTYECLENKHHPALTSRPGDRIYNDRSPIVVTAVPPMDARWRLSARWPRSGATDLKARPWSEVKYGIMITVGVRGTYVGWDREGTSR